MPLPRIAQDVLGIRPVKGPFSKYLGKTECEILIALARSVSPKVMIEIGCNTGMTARRVLDNVATIERYIGVDVAPDHKPTLSCQDGEVPANAGGHAAADERFWLLTSPAPTAADLEAADLIFVDGDHSELAVTRDSVLARALIRKGGIIVWHDHDNPAVEVTPVLERLQQESWPVIAVQGSWIAFCRFP